MIYLPLPYFITKFASLLFTLNKRNNLGLWLTIFTQAQIRLNESVSEGITTMEKAHPNRKLIPEVSCYTDLMIITTTEQKESKRKALTE